MTNWEESVADKSWCHSAIYLEGQKKSHGKPRIGQQIPDLRFEPGTFRIQVYNIAATLRYYRPITNRCCVNFPS